MVEFTVASAESTGFMNNDNGAAPAGSPDWGLGTKAIHAGQAPDPSTGAVMPPIYATSTYAQASPGVHRSEEHTSELQSIKRTSYADLCLKKKKTKNAQHTS